MDSPAAEPERADVVAGWGEALEGFFTQGEVRDLLGRTTRDAELLALWTGDGRVVYPRMQFRGRRAAPGMAEVLAAAPEAIIDRWSLAGWLAAPNRHLDGDRPMDALHDGRREDVLRLTMGLIHRNGD